MPARRTHARTTIPLSARGTLTLAVVADTHSRPEPAAAKHLAALHPDAILHAGDIGDLRVLDRLAEIAPVHAVRGNIDVHAPDVPDTRTLSIVDGADVLAKILLMHIAVDGPRLRADAARAARAEEASIVVCGHSHVPLVARDGDLVVFNPGSIGPRRFSLPIVFGVLEVGRARVTMHHVDARTGERWVPPRTRAT